MNVLLPAPGTPEIPTRLELPGRSPIRRRISRAIGRWAGALLSTRVIAREIIARVHEKIPSTSSSIVGFRRGLPFGIAIRFGGSIPGIILGSYMSAHVPDRVLRPVLAPT